jgi:hypothetical protein
MIRAAFARGELTFSKVRALTRVATPSCEEGLLELAGVLTASQLERALRAFRRLATDDARRAHALEFVSYQFEEDGSLYLRARLPAEDGMLVVKALEAARKRVYERRREERAGAASCEQTGGTDATRAAEPLRSANVEALLEIAETSLASDETPHRVGAPGRPRRRGRAHRRRRGPLRARGPPRHPRRDGAPPALRRGGHDPGRSATVCRSAPVAGAAPCPGMRVPPSPPKKSGATSPAAPERHRKRCANEKTRRERKRPRSAGP